MIWQHDAGLSTMFVFANLHWLKGARGKGSKMIGSVPAPVPQQFLVGGT